MQWYSALAKPSWTPAPATIGLIWQILYPVIVVSFGFVFVQPRAAMSAYWRHIDDTWVKVPEYAGSGFGHLRRWNPERLTEARRLMSAGRAACATEAETARVKLADDSLAAFEMLMQQRRDLADGRWATLAEQVAKYRARMIELGTQYEPQFAFTRMYWLGATDGRVKVFVNGQHVPHVNDKREQTDSVNGYC